MADSIRAEEYLRMMIMNEIENIFVLSRHFIVQRYPPEVHDRMIVKKSSQFASVDLFLAILKLFFN